MAEISSKLPGTNRIEESEVGESSSKRQTIETLTDRLSQLPDSLILHILHLLDDTKQTVRTSALSKRWRNLWTCMQSFSFLHYDIYPRDTLADFVKFVTKALFIHCMDNDKIIRFKISFKLKQRFETHLACWVFYLLCRNVEELDIDLSSVILGSDEFLLPNEILTNWVLTKLRLSNCVLDPDRQIDWKVLRVLCIKHSYVSEDLIENMMNGSPLLASFELGSCRGFNRLNITSASVKKLIFNGYGREDPDLGEIVEINAPKILSLDIIGTLVLQNVLLLDVSSLVEANLNYIKVAHWDSYAKRKETREEMLKVFIQRLHHVKNLTVGDYCSSSALGLEAKGFSFPSNVKYSDVSSSWYSSSDSDYLDSEESVPGDDSEYEDSDESVLGGEEIDNDPDGEEIDNDPDGEEIDNDSDGDEVDHEPDGHRVDHGNNHDEADH